MTDKEKILNEIERLINNHDSALDYEAALEDVRNFIDSMDEEPVSEELEKVSDQYSQSIHSDYSNDMFDRGDIYEAVIYGAKWGKHQAEVEIQAQSMALAHGCPKESITEELEEAANAYISNEINYSQSRTDTFKAGARWHEQQMKEALRTEYEKGRHDALEKMKKSTTEAT